MKPQQRTYRNLLCFYYIAKFQWTLKTSLWYIIRIGSEDSILVVTANIGFSAERSQGPICSSRGFPLHLHRCRWKSLHMWQGQWLAGPWRHSFKDGTCSSPSTPGMYVSEDDQVNVLLLCSSLTGLHKCI